MRVSAWQDSVVACFLFCFACSLLAGDNGGEPRLVVATMNGDKIYYGDIALSLQKIQDYVRGVQADRLVGQIRVLIQEQAADRLGIRVSDEEVNRRVESKFREDGFDNGVASALSAKMRAIADALEAWQKDKSQGRAIYKRMLVNRASEMEWRMAQRCYPTPKDIAGFRSRIPNSLEDIKARSRSSIKKDMIAEELARRVTHDVQATDAEVKFFYERKKYRGTVPRPPLEEVAEQIRNDLLREKRKFAMSAWWVQQLRKAKIDIHDEQLRTMVEARLKRLCSRLDAEASRAVGVGAPPVSAPVPMGE